MKSELRDMLEAQEASKKRQAVSIHLLFHVWHDAMRKKVKKPKSKGKAKPKAKAKVPSRLVETPLKSNVFSQCH